MKTIQIRPVISNGSLYYEAYEKKTSKRLFGFAEKVYWEKLNFLILGQGIGWFRHFQHFEGRFISLTELKRLIDERYKPVTYEDWRP